MVKQMMKNFRHRKKQKLRLLQIFLILVLLGVVLLLQKSNKPRPEERISTGYSREYPQTDSFPTTFIKEKITVRPGLEIIEDGEDVVYQFNADIEGSNASQNGNSTSAKQVSVEDARN